MLHFDAIADRRASLMRVWRSSNIRSKCYQMNAQAPLVFPLLEQEGWPKAGVVAHRKPSSTDHPVCSGTTPAVRAETPSQPAPPNLGGEFGRASIHAHE